MRRVYATEPTVKPELGPSESAAFPSPRHQLIIPEGSGMQPVITPILASPSPVVPPVVDPPVRLLVPSGLADVATRPPQPMTEAIGFFPRMMGFAGYAKIVPVFKMMFLKDKKALKAQVSRWAELSGLARIVPCHGDLVSSSAPNALKSAAATL